MKVILPLLLSLGCASKPGDGKGGGAGADSGTTACDAVPEGKVHLPADDAVHDEPVEWWYWTGHLQDEDGAWYGFEHVFFRFVQGSRVYMMVHHALTDVSAAAFDDDVQFALQDTTPVEDGFDLSLGGQTAKGGDGHDVLHGELDASRLDLTLDALKPPVFQHGDGYTDYDFGGYTWYYSRERMSATGTLDIDGQTHKVTGTGWFDHQWGDLSAATQLGWDWFAIQLDDNREIMLFVIHDANGARQLLGGSITDADCETEQVESYSVTALGEWTSPDSGCTYPAGWQVEVEGMVLDVEPVLADQELVNRVLTYWEGAATVSGDTSGRAYVELTGYCGGSGR